MTEKRVEIKYGLHDEPLKVGMIEELAGLTIKVTKVNVPYKGNSGFTNCEAIIDDEGLDPVQLNEFAENRGSFATDDNLRLYLANELQARMTPEQKTKYLETSERNMENYWSQ